MNFLDDRIAQLSASICTVCYSFPSMAYSEVMKPC